MIPYICIFIVLTLVWNVYFVKMIVYYVRLYRECIKEASTDIFGNASELALHYKAEIVKYAFMLAINAVESIAVLTLEVGFSITLIPSNYEEIDNCTTGSIHSFVDFRVIADPIAAVAISFGEAELLVSLALVICLMKYLDVIYHDIHGEPFKYVRRFLLISCLVGVFAIIIGSIPYLCILQEIFEPVICIIYVCIWVRQTRIFYNTLRWRCVEYRIRGVSRRILRRSRVVTISLSL